MSVLFASYFVTLCTRARQTLLDQPTIADAVIDECRAIETAGHWNCRAGVIMPEHIHLLVRITGHLPISRCIARLKAKTNPRLLARGGSWQGNFYEHRLRPDDSVHDVVRYMFLNPYRRRLLEIGDTYRWFWLGHEDANRFVPTTDKGRPFPEWLK